MMSCLVVAPAKPQARDRGIRQLLEAALRKLEEASCMDPTRLPHAPHALAPDSQTPCGKTQ